MSFIGTMSQTGTVPQAPWQRTCEKYINCCYILITYSDTLSMKKKFVLILDPRTDDSCIAVGYRP